MRKTQLVGIVGLALLFIVSFQQCAPFSKNELQQQAQQSSTEEPIVQSAPTDDEISVGQASNVQNFAGPTADRMYGAIATSDLGTINFGYTKSYSGNTEPNAILVKTDSLGHRVWEKQFGGTSNDQFFSVVELADKSILAVGLSRVVSPGGLDQGFIVKVSAAGDFQWAKRIGNNTSDELFFDVAILDATSVIVVGRLSDVASSARDGIYTKINIADGSIAWAHTLGGPQNESINSVNVMKNGDILLIGTTTSYGAGLSDGWLTRTTASGNILWSKAYGAANDEAYSDAVETPDGKIFAYGTTATQANGQGQQDLLYSVLQSDGTLLMSKTIGGSSTDKGLYIAAAKDGGYILSGASRSFGSGDGYYDGLLLKLSSDFSKILWSRVYGSAGDEYIYRIAETADRRIAFAGFSSVDSGDVNENAVYGILRANGSHSVGCFTSGSRTLIQNDAVISSTVLSLTPQNWSNTVESLSSSVESAISSPAINSCSAT